MEKNENIDKTPLTNESFKERFFKNGEVTFTVEDLNNMIHEKDADKIQLLWWYFLSMFWADEIKELDPETYAHMKKILDDSADPETGYDPQEMKSFDQIQKFISGLNEEAKRSIISQIYKRPAKLTMPNTKLTNTIFDKDNQEALAAGCNIDINTRKPNTNLIPTQAFVIASDTGLQMPTN